MDGYTREELDEALTAVQSIIHKCEAAQKKFPRGTAHHTLLERRLRAMYLILVICFPMVTVSRRLLEERDTRVQVGVE